MTSGDDRRLSQLTVGDAKRILVYGMATALAVAMFGLLVWKVLVALLLGVVAAAYLLPVQEWLEKRLRARAGSALVTMALIVVPLLLVASYTWRELSGYSSFVEEKQNEIINAISIALERNLPVTYEGARAGLQLGLADAVERSGKAIQELQERVPLLIASATIFFFTVFYVLTQRVRLATYIKVRIPGEYLPLYEKLAANVGGALRGALLAVLIDQALKGFIIIVLNFVFGVPLAVVLGVLTFLIGFFPLLGEWAIYIPVTIYLFVFRNDPVSATIYLVIGLTMTIGSSVLLRPRLASAGAGRFNFYWMLVALVAGVYAFGIPGIVLGPAILGFVKAVIDTMFGDVHYETSLLKSEKEQKVEEALEEAEQAASAERTA